MTDAMRGVPGHDTSGKEKKKEGERKQILRGTMRNASLSLSLYSLTLLLPVPSRRNCFSWPDHEGVLPR